MPVFLDQQRLSLNNYIQQIEHNLNFDFSLTDEAGNALEPVFGPGLTGLQNLGNRFISSLFSLICVNSSCPTTAATCPP
jgi:uncharacterized UBP type Zn finger protein